MDVEAEIWQCAIHLVVRATGARFIFFFLRAHVHAQSTSMGGAEEEGDRILSRLHIQHGAQFPDIMI